MTQKIYVGNLPYEATEDELETLFAAYGEVLSVALPTDRETGRARGYGFVEMSQGLIAMLVAAVTRFCSKTCSRMRRTHSRF